MRWDPDVIKPKYTKVQQHLDRVSEDQSYMKSIKSSIPSGSDQQILSPEEQKEINFFDLKPNLKVDIMQQ